MLAQDRVWLIERDDLVRLLPWLHETGDGRLVADRRPETLLIDAALVEAPKVEGLRRADDRLHFTYSNGEATYLLVERDESLNLYRCARLYVRMR